MSNFSVEDRTRTYQPRQDVYLRRGPGDEAFESQLPPEVRTELEGRFPPTAEAFLRPAPGLRWPARIPETEEEIAQAIAWLQSQGYLRPAVSAPPPVAPSVPPPVTPPVQREPRRVGIWLLLATLLGFPVLVGLLPKQFQPGGITPVVEVRRALPVVPRALPVTSALSTVSNAQQQSIRMPDGTVVQASYQGELPSSAALPARGRFIGEEWSTGNTSWIWMTPAGANFPSWVDP